MRRHAEVDVPRRFKTLVTTAAGYPLDETYYQTNMGMVGVLGILDPGGTLVIASECSEGMGSWEFIAAQRLLRELDPDGFMSELLGRERACVDEWQTEMLLKAWRVGKIKLLTTGLSKRNRRKIFVEEAPSFESVVDQSIRECGDTDVVIVPKDPYHSPEPCVM